MKFCLFIFEKTFCNHIQLSGFVYNNLFIPHQFKHTIWTSVSFDPSLFALSPHFSLNLKLTSFPLGLKGVAETQEMFPCLRGMSNLKIHIPLLPLKKEGKKIGLFYTSREQNGKERHFVLPDKDKLSIFINLHSQDNCSCLVRGPFL